MSINTKKKLFLIVLCVIIISLAAFTQKQSDNNEIGVVSINKTNVPIEIEESNSSNFDIEQIKKVITTAINDDIWYNGNFSEYKGFEGKEAQIEIYYRRNSMLTNEFLVVFDKSFEIYERGRKSESKGYFILGFSKFGSGKRGYANKVILSCVRNTKDEVKKEMISDEDVLLAKIDIEFPSATQPEFPSMDSHREKIIENIEDKLPNSIEEMCGKEEGLYKIYIRNFRDTDSTTNVLIEDKDGRQWMTVYGIEDDGVVAPVKSYFEDTNEESIYLANQIKKVSFQKEIMIGKAN